MNNQITKIFIPSRAEIEDAKHMTENKFIEQGYTLDTNVTSILTAEEKQFVSSLGSRLDLLYIENNTSSYLVKMKHIRHADDGGNREMRIPSGFSAKTISVNGQRGLLGYPVVSGG